MFALLWVSHFTTIACTSDGVATWNSKGVQAQGTQTCSNADHAETPGTQALQEQIDLPSVHNWSDAHISNHSLPPSLSLTTISSYGLFGKFSLEMSRAKKIMRVTQYSA